MVMSRTEIRRRALRAAVAVTLSMSFLGCAANVVVDSTEPADDDDELVAAETDPVPAPAPIVVVDAGPGPIDSGVAEAGVDCTMAPDYGLCCDENGWSFEAGCQAWGPPMPPAMGVA